MSIFKNYREYPFTIGDTLFTFISDGNTITQASPTGSFLTPPLHSHRYCEIFFVLHGRIHVVTEHHIYELEEGDCIFIPAELLHTSEYIGDSRRIAAPFFFNKQENSGNTSNYFDYYETLFQKDIKVFKHFIGGDSFRKIAYYYYSNYAEKEELIATCCREIILLLKAALSSENIPVPMHNLTDTDHYRNYLISNFFTEHFSDGTLTQLSHLLHLSTQQTQRLVKKLYRETFQERMVHMKMRHAKNRLLNSEDSISHIAEEAGYTYTHSFFTAFRKYYGTTPDRFRHDKQGSHRES